MPVLIVLFVFAGAMGWGAVHHAAVGEWKHAKRYAVGFVVASAVMIGVGIDSHRSARRLYLNRHTGEAASRPAVPVAQ